MKGVTPRPDPPTKKGVSRSTAMCVGAVQGGSSVWQIVNAATRVHHLLRCMSPQVCRCYGASGEEIVPNPGDLKVLATSPRASFPAGYRGSDLVPWHRRAIALVDIGHGSNPRNF